ncbi:hypothetical protein J4208_04335 [Candidatus Woesearchaeota archaeon]|nr:hypothetical protein [Candidatus Woesearchaeota archaeon]
MLVDTHSTTLLTWEEFDRSVPNRDYNSLVQKAQTNLWTPEPPIIISPMPASYAGKYTHFLYNGHTRLSIAREFQVPLHALVVHFDQEIPAMEELIGPSSLESVLRGIVCRKMHPHPTLNLFWYAKQDLSFLMQEFQTWEEQQLQCA